MTIDTENLSDSINKATRIKKWVYKGCLIQDQYTNQLYFYILTKMWKLRI